MGKLMILFKDKGINKSEFDHLADVIIHNQYVNAPSSSSKKFIEFIANDEELERLAWCADFAKIDILYVLDATEDIRERHVANFDTSCYKPVDIILVQLRDTIHCVKNKSGMKTRLRFACSNVAPVDVNHAAEVQQILDEAKEIRESLIISAGGVCNRCGFGDSLSALGLYKIVPVSTDRPEGFVSLPIILFGKIRPFDDIYDDSQAGEVLCMNCIYTIKQKKKMMKN